MAHLCTPEWKESTKKTLESKFGSCVLIEDANRQFCYVVPVGRKKRQRIERTFEELRIGVEPHFFIPGDDYDVLFARAIEDPKLEEFVNKVWEAQRKESPNRHELRQEYFRRQAEIDENYVASDRLTQPDIRIENPTPMVLMVQDGHLYVSILGAGYYPKGDLAISSRRKYLHQLNFSFGIESLESERGTCALAMTDNDRENFCFICGPHREQFPEGYRFAVSMRPEGGFYGIACQDHLSEVFSGDILKAFQLTLDKWNEMKTFGIKTQEKYERE